MIPSSNAKKLFRSAEPATDGLIPFPVRSRLRCPRCGAGRQTGRGATGYLCESSDQIQSEACEKLANERKSKVLMADTQQILRKFGFGAISNLQMVK